MFAIKPCSRIFIIHKYLGTRTLYVLAFYILLDIKSENSRFVIKYLRKL